jgi:uncharacterized membrane protein
MSTTNPRGSTNVEPLPSGAILGIVIGAVLIAVVLAFMCCQIYPTFKNHLTKKQQRKIAPVDQKDQKIQKSPAPLRIETKKVIPPQIFVTAPMSPGFQPDTNHVAIPIPAKTRSRKLSEPLQLLSVDSAPDLHKKK